MLGWTPCGCLFSFEYLLISSYTYVSVPEEPDQTRGPVYVKTDYMYTFP